MTATGRATGSGHSPSTGSGQAPTRTELVWPGKNTQVERIALPFQVVETINQSRATREQTPIFAGLPPPPLFEGQFNPSSASGGSGQAPDTAWKNKLIWGENKYVLASLLQGDPSVGLEALAGKVDLIYIDPPFATGQDFSYSVRVGDEEWVKEASIIEEKAYRDTWGRGMDSYLQMMYERLVLLRDLLAENGSIYVHCDWRLVGALRIIMEEVFHHIENVISWKRSAIAAGVKTQWRNSQDFLLYFSKSGSHTFNPQFGEYSESSKRHYNKSDARGFFRTVPLMASGRTAGPSGQPWRGVDVARRGKNGMHWLKSPSVLEALETKGEIYWNSEGVPELKYYTDEAKGVYISDFWDDIVVINSMADEYQNYMTQKPEALLERIIKGSSNEGDLVADFFCGSGTTMAVAEKLGRRWIGCDLSRYAIQVSRKRMLDIPGCQPFQVLNLGKYERQHWQVNVLNGRQQDGSKAITDYLRFIVALYHGEPVGGYVHLHGQKAGRWVHVGASDAPVTRAEIMDAVQECQANRYTGLDVLGWEWEMGLHDTIRDEARRMSVDLRCLYIPREVMDKRAVQAGDIHFYELAYLKTALLQDGRTVTVRLEDFIIPNLDLVPEEVRGKVKRWSDYIDFWAVDWNYHQDTFHNEWQTYRTRKSPTLRLISDPHDYSGPGNYRVLVKVIDIFGNDTTQLLEGTT